MPIEYNVKIKGKKVVDKIKFSSDVDMAEITELVFLFNKKINEMCELDDEKMMTLIYPIDEDGKFKEDKEE